MLFNGRKLEIRLEEEVPFSRLDKEGKETFDIYKIKRVDMSSFFSTYLKPVPPIRANPQGIQVVMEDDPEYVKTYAAWSKLSCAFLVIRALEDNEGLVWEKVNLSDPSTYEEVFAELEDCLEEEEIEHLVLQIKRLNGYTDTNFEEIKKRFLAQRLKESL